MPENSSRIESLEISGSPSGEEERAILAAVEAAIEQERRARSSSLWLRSARAHGRRLGMLDYRDRFSKDDAWRLSMRFPFGGREYPGKNGRGDSK